ncbi:hypothetical protein [Streptomyces winkii]|uniref:hypothetical protein n=1 Tax=Streptomyces winkii TaxID=3051178 RepID=UPI0028D5212B|nr:hypothetical protein [Streptomyces sp. DSM 40971]
MHKQFKRAAVVATAVVAGTLGAMAPQAAAATHAGPADRTDDVGIMGGCVGPWGWVCGGVENDTDRHMKYTANLRYDGSSCRVWYWADDNDKPRDASCDPEEKLAPGDDAGGFGSDKDVDAFTFTGTGYYVSVYGNAPEWVDKGVWTKIQTIDVASCAEYANYDAPVCDVDTFV